MLHFIFLLLQIANNHSYPLANNTINANNTLVYVIENGTVMGNFTGRFSTVKTVGIANSSNFNIYAVPDLISAVLKGSPSELLSAIARYGYYGEFVFMLLDGSSLPPPSELILPPAGFFAKRGYLDFGLSFLVIMLANIMGMSVDYTLGYYLGSSILAKKGGFLRIKDRVQDFLGWFEKNNTFLVFIFRFIPVIRTWISIPAGATRMNLPKFFLFSIMGAIIYNYILMLLGYFLISEESVTYILAFMIVLGFVSYILYKYAVKKIKLSVG